MEEKRIYREKKLRNGIIIVSSCTILGFLYPVLSREFGDPVAFLNGILIGFLGGSFIALYEQNIIKITATKMNFLGLLLTKSTVYTFVMTIIIIGVISFTRSIELRTGFFPYLSSPTFGDFILHGDFLIIVLYTLLLSASVSFVRQLSRKMGQGILWYIVSGKYHTPRSESRIFMYIDVTSSTTIAEKLGDLKFNRLINDLFHDVTPGVIVSGGEIYRYIGDEMVISWKMKDGLKNAKCVRAYFLALSQVKRNKEEYFNQYGIVPKFTASLHCGEVIRGEIGDVKMEIAYHGEVLNQTSQIQKKCGDLDYDFLISSELIQLLSIPPIFEMKPAGEIALSAKRILDLYTINEVQTVPME